jgi:anti-anti-sigma regulatory factor
MNALRTPQAGLQLVSLIRPPSGTTLCVDGEVDLATVGGLSQALHHQLEARPVWSEMVVDLSAVGFISLRGLTALEAAVARAADEGIEFHVSGCPASLVRMLDVLNVELPT